MGLYDAFKDALNVAQKADNVELYRKILDLSAQALDLQAENARLKEENAELRKKKDLSERIVRHSDPYITLKDENPTLYYCIHCWDVDGRLVQLHCNDYNGSFRCPHCEMAGTYDKAKEKAAMDELMQINTNPFSNGGMW